MTKRPRREALWEGEVGDPEMTRLLRLLCRSCKDGERYVRYSTSPSGAGLGLAYIEGVL